MNKKQLIVVWKRMFLRGGLEMRKILLGIVVLLLMVSVGYCQEQALQLTIKSDKEVNKVIVTTNNIQYTKYQDIRIFITNNFSQEIWYGPGFTVPFTTIYIENKTDKGWQGVYPYIPAPTILSSPSQWIKHNAAKLMPGQKVEIVWNQQTGQYRGGDGKQVNSGKYRVKFIYYTFSFEQAESWTSHSWEETDRFKGIVYSDEFEIKERVESKIEKKSISKEEAIKLVQNYIRKQNINVIDINTPSEIRGEHDDFWSISYAIEQEPVVLPPFRSFNVHKDDGRTYEVPRE